jgi:hypothetical protein
MERKQLERLGSIAGNGGLAALLAVGLAMGVIASGVGANAVAGGGEAVREARSPSRADIAPAAGSSIDDHFPGDEPLTRLTIVPRSVDASADASHLLDASLELRTGLAGPVRMRYAVEIVEAGVRSPVELWESNNIDVAAAAGGLAAIVPGAIRIPDLGNGHFFLRVTAVVTDGAAEGGDEAVLYYAVTDEDIAILDPIEWFDRSGAMQATRLVEAASSREGAR